MAPATRQLTIQAVISLNGAVEREFIQRTLARRLAQAMAKVRVVQHAQQCGSTGGTVAAREQQAVERLLGIDVCHKLRQISAAIFTNVDEDLSSLRAAYTLLRGTLKELYPKTKFLEILFDESPRRDSVAA